MEKIGRIAAIHLKEKRITYLDSKDYYRWLGGRGFAIYEYNHLSNLNFDIQMDSYPIILSTGSLTGSIFPNSSRLCMASPNMNKKGCSIASVGGGLGIGMKNAGLDGLIIEGKSDNPIYILIKNNGISLCDASDLWGLPVEECVKHIKSRYPKMLSHIGTIGPAGEHRLGMASLIVDESHAVFCNGCGAVFGGKMLKAIVSVEECNCSNAKKSSINFFEDDFSILGSACKTCPIQCRDYLRALHTSTNQNNNGKYGKIIRIIEEKWQTDDINGILKVIRFCNSNGLDIDCIIDYIAQWMECNKNNTIHSSLQSGYHLVFGDISEVIPFLKSFIESKTSFNHQNNLQNNVLDSDSKECGELYYFQEMPRHFRHNPLILYVVSHLDSFKDDLSVKCSEINKMDYEKMDFHVTIESIINEERKHILYDSLGLCNYYDNQSNSRENVRDVICNGFNIVSGLHYESTDLHKIASNILMLEKKIEKEETDDGNGEYSALNEIMSWYPKIRNTDAERRIREFIRLYDKALNNLN